MHIWIEWPIAGVLARGARPGYAPGAEFAVGREVVDAWIGQVRARGVVSILCLLDADQLPLYARALPNGLLAYYRAAGFAVAHLPAPDGRAQPYTPDQLDAAVEAFRRLPKPVLVHCSAGVDRTGRVVQHILRRLAETGDEGAVPAVPREDA
jgi:protein tyrosine phosphatase (PTP) superfamily phosphohydrolase (DUF442 family)